MKQFVNFMIWFVAIPVWGIIFIAEMYVQLICDKPLNAFHRFNEFVTGKLLK